MSASSTEIGAADGLAHLTGSVSSRCHDAGCGLVRGLSGAHLAGGEKSPPVLFSDSGIGPSAGARVQSAVSKRGEAPAADLAQRSPIRPAGATIPAGGNVKGTPWAAAEIATLRREWDAGTPAAGIVALLPGRTLVAVWEQRQKLDLPKRTAGTRRTLDRAELRRLVEVERLSICAAARRLGCNADYAHEVCQVEGIQRPPKVVGPSKRQIRNAATDAAWVARRDAILQHLAAGMTAKNAGAACGMSESMAGRTVLRFGLSVGASREAKRRAVDAARAERKAQRIAERAAAKAAKARVPKPPKPAPPKKVPATPIGALMRAAALPTAPKPAPAVTVETCGDPKVAKARAMLAAGGDPYEAHKRSGVPLAQVYRLRAEMAGRI